MFNLLLLSTGYFLHANAWSLQRSFQGCMQMIHIDDHLADLRALEQGLIGTFENVSLDMCAIIDRYHLKLRVVLVPYLEKTKPLNLFIFFPGVFLTTVSMVVAVPRHGILSAATVVALDTLELPAIPVSVNAY